MTRDELIEVMARAIWKDDYGAMLYEAREYSGQPNGESAWREVEWMREAATAALTAIEAAGMRVVPVEPTVPMIKAGVDHRITTSVGGENTWPTDTATLYRAMIHAFYGDAFRRLAQEDGQ